MPYPIAAVRGRGGTGVAPFQLPKNLLTSSTLLEDFEDESTWQTLVNATATADATYVSEGTQSVRMTCAGAGACKMDKTTSFVTDGNLRVDLYVDRSTSVTFYLSSTAAYTKYMQANIAAPLPGWNTICLAPSDWIVAGGATWADTVIRVRLQINSGDAGRFVSFDNMLGNVVAQPAALFTFDDGYDDIIDTAYPIFAAKGLKATAFIVTGLVGEAGFMTWAQCQTLDAAGWDIANHTTNHGYLDGLTEAQVATEVTNARLAIEAQGLTRASRHVAYPNSRYDDNTFLGMATAGMESGRTAEETAIAMPVLNWYRVHTINNLDSGLSLAAAKVHIDTAIARQQVIVFYGHKVEAAAGANTWASADLAALLDYVRAKHMPALTISQLYGLASAPLTLPGY